MSELAILLIDCWKFMRFFLSIAEKLSILVGIHLYIIIHKGSFTFRCQCFSLTMSELSPNLTWSLEVYMYPSPAWQVQFTRSEEIGIVIITMQHRLGIKRNALYSTEVQHPFPLVRATLVHFYFYACCPSFRSPVLFCIVLKKGLSKFSNSTPDPWLPAATTYESPSQSQSRLMLSS